MKSKKALGMVFAPLFAFGILVAAIKVLADPPQPVISIATAGTNSLAITVTNGVNTANYDLYWTPVLANADYPWTAAAIGSTGQTNFTISTAIYDSGFFRVLLETTNAVPPWKAADPSDTNSGVLMVFIDSPTNGSTISQ